MEFQVTQMLFAYPSDGVCTDRGTKFVCTMTIWIEGKEGEDIPPLVGL